jgi:hypothetical protein
MAVTADALVPICTIGPANHVAGLLVVLRGHLMAVGRHRPNHFGCFWPEHVDGVLSDDVEFFRRTLSLTPR